MKCVYCCRTANQGQVSAEPAAEEILSCVKQIIQCRGTFVVIQGGEPLLRRDAHSLIAAMGRLKETVPGFYYENLRKLLKEEHPARHFALRYKKLIIAQKLPLYCITTNGMVYRESIAESLYNSGFSTEISLDSPFRETNEATRIGIDYDRVTDHIARYAQTLPVEISCTITEQNVHEIQDMIAFARDLGCVCLKFSPVIMIGKREGGAGSWEQEYLASLVSALEKHKSSASQLFLKIKLSPHMLEDDQSRQLLDRIMAAPNVLLEMHHCSAFTQIKDVYIDTDFNVYGCASMKNEKSLIIGNLSTHTLKELWNSPRRLQLAQQISPAREQAHLYGGCTAAAYSRISRKEGHIVTN